MKRFVARYMCTPLLSESFLSYVDFELSTQYFHISKIQEERTLDRKAIEGHSARRGGENVASLPVAQATKLAILADKVYHWFFDSEEVYRLKWKEFRIIDVRMET